MNNLVVCTIGSKSLDVLIASLEAYLPEDVEIFLFGSSKKVKNHITWNLTNTPSSFGEAYNNAVNTVFQKFNNTVICSDDVVLDPNSWQLLKEDVFTLKNKTDKLGWVASRSNFARGFQNIRWSQPNDFLTDKYKSESEILEIEAIAPFFAYIEKPAWVDFLPINWFSDDIQCWEIIKNGFRNYISRSYVHHVGSFTIGDDCETNKKQSLNWLFKNNMEKYNEVIKFIGL
jgi:hypothetical protein